MSVEQERRERNQPYPTCLLTSMRSCLLMSPCLSQRHFRGRIGIPRVLNMYENYPLWHTIFTHLGYEVVLSPKSSKKLYEKGMGYIPSESVCYPAKLTHGHITGLIEQNVDLIFYPSVIYEKKEFEETTNRFNCSVVASYPEVIRVNTGEMIELIGSGVHNIACIQPFACLPNHVTGRGMLKGIKELYPEANITAIDYDASESAVNQVNRLKLMITTAFKNIERNEAKDKHTVEV